MTLCTGSHMFHMECRLHLRGESLRNEADQRSYPPTKVMTTYALRHSCRLNIILESILTNMYSPERPNARSLSFVRTASERLEAWRRDQPVDLKIDGPIMPLICPPTHIVLQKYVHYNN